MNKDETFQVWAPDESPWSPWVKPVLFAHLQTSEVTIAQEPGGLSGIPAANEKAALVINLPGAEGVLTGLALASRGYRPIPLYNALPPPIGRPTLYPHDGEAVAAVNVYPILNALNESTEKLAKSNLLPNAPPAFLLDFNRQGDRHRIERDEFDNRSVSFTTDFPSAIFLASQGIERVILIQKDSNDIQSDLAHTFSRWQEGGLKLARLRLDNPATSEAFQVSRPSWYGAMFQRVLIQFGLRRSPAGGFGAWFPDSTSGG